MLSEEQIVEYVARCPAENRWAFEGWLRGERQLDGDPIEAEPCELWQVQLWLGDHLIEQHVAPPLAVEQRVRDLRLRVGVLPGREIRCARIESDLGPASKPVREG
ncbi:hypothetical protein PWY87_09095 [Kribbella solani]|uniref:hypothetical protein n=1 Tax=Kribbella solani TaxID=236067 RepID=UPI0029BC7264|nr:hypothetical protein [Kribbella solani]MDX2969485.1 hypothetical protein [Kribbella solani]MDX3001821.1 hypothetical protein [Kribbella solani]